jgi:hypothetical protein
MHDDEFEIDAALARRLVDRDVPRFSRTPLRRLAASGSTNVLFRLGPNHLVRLPRQPGGGNSIESEARWLAHLAPALRRRDPPIPHYRSSLPARCGWPSRCWPTIARRELTRKEPADLTAAIARSEKRFRDAGSSDSSDLVCADRDNRPMTRLLIDTSVLIKWFHEAGEGEVADARAYTTRQPSPKNTGCRSTRRAERQRRGHPVRQLSAGNDVM